MVTPESAPHPHGKVVAEMPTLPDLLTPAEVAVLCDTSERTVQRWAANGRIPAHRVGDRIAFTPSDVAMLPGASSSTVTPIERLGVGGRHTPVWGTGGPDA